MEIKERVRNIFLLLLCLCVVMTTQNIYAQQSTEKKRTYHKKVAKLLPTRQDVRKVPQPLKDRIVLMSKFPHTYTSTPILNEFVETGKDGLLTQYYLLDARGFEPNAFTRRFIGITNNTFGAVRVVTGNEPGKPTDPNDPRTHIEIFTDISGAFTIQNESGWYESWLMHDITVPSIAESHSDGSAQFGRITPDDAAALRTMGIGNNVPGNLFTLDGGSPRFPSAEDLFPTKQSNLLPLFLSLGTFNSIQELDIHTYRQFIPTTNWVFPVYELAFTGGLPGIFGKQITGGVSLIPGSGPTGIKNDPDTYGDNASDPRDADRSFGDQLEFRHRAIPSALAREILLDTFVRIASFEPEVKDMKQRLFDAYAKQIARVDKNSDGSISFEEADIDDFSDGLSNARLYLPITSFRRFAITREINDGLLAPRFAPSQRAFIVSGSVTFVDSPQRGVINDLDAIKPPL